MLSALGKLPVGDAHPLRLTPRGAQVFALIAQGMDDTSISRHLGISYSGVRRHREKMLLQNKCNSMLELLSKHRCLNSESEGTAI